MHTANPSHFSSAVLALDIQAQIKLFQVLLSTMCEHFSWRVDRPGPSIAFLDSYCSLLGCSIYIPEQDRSFASTQQIVAQGEITLPDTWQFSFPEPNFLHRLRGLTSLEWDLIEADSTIHLPQELLSALLPPIFSPQDPLPPLPEHAEDLVPTLIPTPTQNALGSLEIQVFSKKTSQRYTAKREVFLALQDLPLGSLFRVVAFFLNNEIRQEVYRIQVADSLPLFLSSYHFFEEPGLSPPQFFLPIPLQSGKLLLPGSKEIKRMEQAYPLHEDSTPLLAFLEPILIKEEV